MGPIQGIKDDILKIESETEEIKKEGAERRVENAIYMEELDAIIKDLEERNALLKSRKEAIARENAKSYVEIFHDRVEVIKPDVDILIKNVGQFFRDNTRALKIIACIIALMIIGVFTGVSARRIAI